MFMVILGWLLFGVPFLPALLSFIALIVMFPDVDEWFLGIVSCVVSSVVFDRGSSNS